MKKLKTHYAIILLIASYFLFNGCIPRKAEIVNYGSLKFDSWIVYAETLQDEGYTGKAAEHIAKVEFKLIPSDAYYIALMED